MAQIDKRGQSPIFRLPLPAACGASAVVFFRAKLNVDVDGSKTAYGPGNEGTDYTANAGEPHHWWALVCGPDGAPIERDGYYVSTTSLQDHNFAADDRRRYVDAQSIPFIVLPASRFAAWGLKIGDLAWVQLLDQGSVVAACAAIFADAGPEDRGGERGTGAQIISRSRSPPRRHGPGASAVFRVRGQRQRQADDGRADQRAGAVFSAGVALPGRLVRPDRRVNRRRSRSPGTHFGSVRCSKM